MQELTVQSGIPKCNKIEHENIYSLMFEAWSWMLPCIWCRFLRDAKLFNLGIMAFVISHTLNRQ